MYTEGVPQKTAAIWKVLKGSVRTKILIVVFGVLLLPVVLLFVEGRILLNAITPLEDEVLTKQRLRFERLVDLEFNELRSDVLGWAIWTDFWNYVDHPNDPAWITWRITNVDEFVPRLHQVQLIVVADPRGEVLHQYGDNSDFAVGRNIGQTPLFRTIVERRNLTGFLRTTEGYYAIAASTIHKTEDIAQSGPANGIYLIGRRVDANYLDERFSVLLAPVALDVDGARIGEEGGVSTSAVNGRSQRTFMADEMTIAFPLKDVLFDASVPTVRITESRSLFRIAYTQLLQTGIAISALVLGALILTFFIFQQVVFRPLYRFLRQVEESGRVGKLTSVVVAKTGDEFEHLTKTYNSMVEAVNRAEEQLLTSQKFLRTVLETITLPIVVVDQESDRVTMVNPAGRALLVDAIGTRDWTDFTALLKAMRMLDGGMYPPAKNPYSVAKSKGRIAQADDVKLVVKGTDVFFSVTAQPLILSSADRPQILVALFDISKQYEVERLRTEFADIVAHQLRTPLTALKWAVEAAQKATAEERDAYLAKIADTVDHTLTLINQLLNIARLAAGRLTFQAQPVVLKPEIDALLTDMQPLITGKELRVTVDVPARLQAQADGNGLREVLRNLLSNAVKYTPARGTITVRGRAESDAVVLSVADSGIGIPPEEQSQIFEKFFRASNVGAEEGTGLGLATVKDFTEAMGGSVRFESAVGKGTTFFLRLRPPAPIA